MFLFLIPFYAGNLFDTDNGITGMLSATPVDTIDAETRARISNTYGKLPLRFEVNEGQTDEQVKFIPRGNGYGLYLTPSEAVLVLIKWTEIRRQKAENRRQEKVMRARSVTLSPVVSLSNHVEGSPPSTNAQSHAVIRMKLINANPAPEMKGENPLVTRSNYFIGSDPKKWRGAKRGRVVGR